MIARWLLFDHSKLSKVDLPWSGQWPRLCKDPSHGRCDRCCETRREKESQYWMSFEQIEQVRWQIYQIVHSTATSTDIGFIKIILWLPLELLNNRQSSYSWRDVNIWFISVLPYRLPALKLSPKISKWNSRFPFKRWLYPSLMTSAHAVSTLVTYSDKSAVLFVFLDVTLAVVTTMKYILLKKDNEPFQVPRAFNCISIVSPFKCA